MQSSLLVKFLGPFGKDPCSLGSLAVGAQACVGREGQKMERTFESLPGGRWFMSWVHGADCSS